MQKDQKLASLISEAGRVYGTRNFLEYQGNILTFESAMVQISEVAETLALKGLKAGDRFLIAHVDPIKTIIQLFAASKVGAVCAICDPAASDHMAKKQLADLLPFNLSVDPGTNFKLSDDAKAQARTIRSPDDAALIIYSSGSTGSPKGIVLSHKNIDFVADRIQERLALAATDRIACLLPLTFDYGLYQVFLALRNGCSVVFGAPLELGSSILNFLVDRSITVLPTLPTLTRMLLSLAGRQNARIPKLRLITNTGEAMSETLLSELQTTFAGAEVFPMFGLTECKRVSILLPSEIADRPTSVGRPLSGTRCGIVDESGKPVGANTLGELVVYGPHVALEYWRDPELSRRVFQGSENGSRALFTGDKASMDTEGYLYFSGRNDAVFKRYGYRASAVEIAAAAEQLPGVSAALCLPPGKNCLNELVLIVTGSGQQSEIADGLKDILFRHQIPDRIFAFDELELTAHGKIDIKAVTRKMEEMLLSKEI